MDAQLGIYYFWISSNKQTQIRKVSLLASKIMLENKKWRKKKLYRKFYFYYYIFPNENDKCFYSDQKQ